MSANRTQNPYATPVPRDYVSKGEAPKLAKSSVFGGYSAYAVRDVPESTDPNWTTGYATPLKAGGSPDGASYPDDIRMGFREPPPNDSTNDPEWNAIRVSDELKRHTVEETISNGWQIQQRRVDPPKMPIWEQERPPTRPTASMSPITHLKRRPEHHPRPITEAIGPDAVTHFSLADHRRVYKIMGQRPQGRMRTNTFRAEPRPWDEDLYTPPPTVNMLSGLGGNRSYRLNG